MLIDNERKKKLLKFQKKLGLKFKKLDLLNQALSHRSFINENRIDSQNNENLEFLGDSVLGIVACEHLYILFAENKNEGFLSKLKSALVSKYTLSRIAKKFEVDKYILIGKGEEISGGRQKKAILADTMEAIFGALFLDHGFKLAKKFIIRSFKDELQLILANKHEQDYKTILQEYIQKKEKVYPNYKLIKKEGPDHNRTFYIDVYVKNRVLGSGIGKSKKEAEQEAAKNAYQKLVSPVTITKPKKSGTKKGFAS